MVTSNNCCAHHAMVKQTAQPSLVELAVDTEGRSSWGGILEHNTSHNFSPSWPTEVQLVAWLQPWLHFAGNGLNEAAKLESYQPDVCQHFIDGPSMKS